MFPSAFSCGSQVNGNSALPPIISKEELSPTAKPFRYPKLYPFFLFLLALFFGGALPVVGAEYFVSKQGNDANDGRTVDTAFLTIGKGVEVLGTGETLTIGPGEYSEAIFKEKLGGPEADTVIRAAIPGTVLLRGDTPLPNFRKVDGYRFVYVADFDQMPQAVNEADTLTIFDPSPSIRELDYKAGQYYYDAGNRKLYISSSDLKAPTEHRYTAGVIHATGLHLLSPRRVRLEGLAATGFNTGVMVPSRDQRGTMWGFFIKFGNDCIIRDCTAYLNGSGIGTLSGEEGGRHLIERCTAYGNYSRFNTSGGNIVAYSPNGDEIRDSYGYRSLSNGIRLYGSFKGEPSRLTGNIAWGNEMGDLWVKGDGNETLGSASNNIALGKVYLFDYANCIVGAKNHLTPKPPGNIWFPSESNLKTKEEFADPENFDFRLQSTSRFRDSEPGGKERGPFPYRANIYYLSPTGDDAADGLSVRHAWKSLERACRALRPGDTLYLEPGSYPGNVTLKAVVPEGPPISIKGRGTAPALLTGLLTIEANHGIRLERLNFSKEVTVAGGSAVEFKNCLFAGSDYGLSAEGVDGLRVLHCSFTGFANAGIKIGKGCARAFLSGNLFDNRSSPAVIRDQDASLLYSDYNSYRGGRSAWRENGTTVSLEELQKRHDAYSRELVPIFTTVNGVPQLENRVLFATDGGLGTPFGVYKETKERKLNVIGPEVYSVSDTTANIEWSTSHPAVFEIAWGKTPECENVTYHAVDSFGTFSLTDLEPGTPYYFQLRKGTFGREYKAGEAIALDLPSLSLVTAASPPVPRTYYVSNEGSDSNTGLSRDQMWKTVSHAADRMNAGDTLLIAPGQYCETVRVRASGTKAAPITFRPLDDGRVDFDGAGRLLFSAFCIQGKSHILIDGFYFKDFSNFAKTGVIDFNRADAVTVSRCFSDGRGPGFAPWFIRASSTKNLVISNCVIMSSFHGLWFESCPGLRISNNVFMRNMIMSMTVINSAKQPFYVENNIFTDNMPKKIKAGMFEISGTTTMKFDNNAFLLRNSDKRLFLFVLPKNGTTRMSLAEYSSKIAPNNSLLADPLFAVLAGDKANADRFPADVLADPTLKLDFPDLFSTNPELLERGIGLQPKAFEQFPKKTAGAETKSF